MKKSIIVILGLVVLGFFSSQAQADFTKGYIKLELTDVSSQKEEMAAGLEMMKGMTMETFFSDKKTLTQMNMMGGMMKTQSLVDIKSKDAILLFDMMGQKIMVKTNQDNMMSEEDKKKAMGKIKMESFKSETKKILGYECYKVVIDLDQASNMKMYAYVTEQIKASSNNLQGFEAITMKGFPLEFKMEMGTMMSMTYTAVEIKKELDESVFNLDTKGYKEMTFEEFQKSMGGMSGGGLGF